MLPLCVIDALADRRVQILSSLISLWSDTHWRHHVLHGRHWPTDVLGASTMLLVLLQLLLLKHE